MFGFEVHEAEREEGGALSTANLRQRRDVKPERTPRARTVSRRSRKGPGCAAEGKRIDCSSQWGRGRGEVLRCTEAEGKNRP